MRVPLPILAALAFGGCSSFAPSDEGLPAGAVPFVAPASYQAWFERTRECAGLNGRYGEIEWYVVPEVGTFATEAGPKVGMWEKSGRMARIILAGRYTEHEMVVRHEMLHHLLDREGHPPEYFVDRCRLTWESWATATHAD
jgi:hypothetical protein